MVAVFVEAWVFLAVVVAFFLVAVVAFLVAVFVEA